MATGGAQMAEWQRFRGLQERGLGDSTNEALTSHYLLQEGVELSFESVLRHRTCVAQSWYTYGMSRVRVSTTVDEQRLANARLVRPNTPDATLLDEALAALIAKHRATEVDASYAAYDKHPLEQADEWGDLASFREAAAAS